MRVVVLTHEQDRHFYFCNEIIERSGCVVGVVTGGKALNRSRDEIWAKRLARLKSHGPSYYLRTLRNRCLNKIFRKAGRRLTIEKETTEQHFFGGSKDRFKERHLSLLLARVDKPYRSINDGHYVSLIRSAKPNVIVVMGTCLVGQAIIDSAAHVLNLHTGLAPYYRGSRTNLWPFVEGEHGYFGVTIHAMSLGVDSGDILYTVRPPIYRDDTYATINSRCIVLGTRLMGDAIDIVRSGSLRPVIQWTDGKHFRGSDWNSWFAHRYYKTRDSFLSRYCDLINTGTLPEVRLVSQGRGG